MKEYINNVPVLFLVFNRLDTTKIVFSKIREAKPAKLYIASDGPRKSKNNEENIVKEIRNYILNRIDWECKVETLFRSNNLGCKEAISSAIDWFFDNEEMGIILEDDCKPNQSFFTFCEELLTKYRNDKRVWHIAGNNFGYDRNGSVSYLFSRWGQVWGWATWRDRWHYYEKNLDSYIKDLEVGNKRYMGLELSNIEYKKLKERFVNAARGKINTWDYQWHATIIKNKGLSIFPTQNLISNIGDGEDATHTKGDNERTHLATKEIDSPLIHPNDLVINKNFDEFIMQKMGIRITFRQRVKLFVKRFIKLNYN